MTFYGPRERKLGEILVHMGKLTQVQIDEALRLARSNNQRLGRFLIEREQITADALRDALAMQANLPTVDLSNRELPDELGKIFPYRAMRDHACVPFEDSPTFVCLAVSEPLKASAVRELEYGCQRTVKLFVGQEELVKKKLDHMYRGNIPRQFTRFEARIPVEVQFCSRLGTPIEEEFSFVTTVDVSQGGLAVLGIPKVPAFVTTEHPKSLYARVVLKDPDFPVKTMCQVRWVRRFSPEADHHWLAGMEIVELSPVDQQQLTKLCGKLSRGPQEDPPAEA